MAIRRHFIAARNTSPQAFGDALSALKVSEVEEAGGWCWAMASVWFTGGGDLLQALEGFEGPVFLVTTEDACRWRLHLRGKGQPDFDTVHEFLWINRDRTAGEADQDWKDLEDDVLEVNMVELGAPPPLPPERLEPLDFDDDFFEPYSDGGEGDDEDDGEDADQSPWEQIVTGFEENGAPLPPDLVDTLATLPDSEVYSRFLELHGALIAEKLDCFGIPHDRAETLRILNGENLTPVEMDSDVGNLWRFLHHLGLGPKFAEAFQEREEEIESAPAPAEDPAAHVIKSTGRLPLQAVAGGPTRIALEEVLLLARAASYQDAQPEFALRVRFDAPVEWPKGRTPNYSTWTPARKGHGVDVSLQGLDVPLYPRARQRLGAVLASLPDGGHLELLAKGRLAKLRFAGTVAAGTWLVDAASAPLADGDMDEMLAIFRAAEARAPQTARDEAEAEAILDRAAHHIALCNDPPRRNGLQLQCELRREAEVLGSLFFRRRMAHAWNFARIESENARRYRDWRKFEEQLARENALPATGVVVYAGKASRFLEADYKARSVDKAMREKGREARATDKTMAGLGYTFLGAVVCERVGGGILRCYANAEERAYSVNYLLPYGQSWHDYSTRFDNGVVMTTGNGFTEGSLRSLRILMRACHDKGIGELHAEHRNGVARLQGRGMAPVAIEATLEGVCRAMDAFLVRRMGAETAD